MGGGMAGLKYMAIFFLFMQALDNFAHFESLKRMGAQLKTENVSFFLWTLSLWTPSQTNA